MNQLNDVQVYERFWSKVNKTDSCWIWTGAKDRKGYGYYAPFQNHGMFGSRFAHRISYYITNGNFDDSLDVLHHCDNPSCVNPEHLFLGTHSDNMKDMGNKGRQHLQVNPKGGEDNHNAKLNWNIVSEIRILYSKGLSKAELSRRFNVTRRTIKLIVENKAWVE